MTRAIVMGIPNPLLKAATVLSKKIIKSTSPPYGKPQLFFHLECGGQLIQTGVIRSDEMQYACKKCKHGGGLLTPNHEIARVMYDEGDFSELPKVVEFEKFTVIICQLLIPTDEWQRVLQEDLPEFLEERGFQKIDPSQNKFNRP
jgi:hypothetical protein